MQITSVKVTILPHGEGLELPVHATPDAAGLDLRAAIPDNKVIKLWRGDYELIPCGISIELPEGTQAEVRPRSGLALRHGVTVLNSPGTVDADYRGELGVMLINHGEKPFEIRRGDRIGQMVVMPYIRCVLDPVKELTETERGLKGYGSTGNR